MKIVDISSELFQEFNEPSDSSIPSISYFLRSQVGKLNVLLYESFMIEESSGQYEILASDGSEISPDAVAILKKIFEIYRLDFQIRSQMNAQATDTVLEFREADGSSFKKINRNESSKVYVSLKKDELQSLKDLVTAYRIKKAVPQQTIGDDVYEGIYDPNYNGGTFRNFNQ